MSDAAVNESLKNVCRIKELIKTFLELANMDNIALLILAIELLDKSEDILASKL